MTGLCVKRLYCGVIKMNDAVRKALKKMKELKVEIERLEQFIRTYEELSGSEVKRDELTVDVKNGENSTNIARTIDSTPVKKRRNNISKLLKVAERLINEANMPLTRTEIADGMVRLGFTVHASDIPKYLGTLLWRNDDRFVSVGDGYITAKMAKARRALEIAADHVDDDVDREIADLLK